MRSGRSILVLAVAYFVAAKLGLKLALVNDYATAVWPPTGIALAALLLWGPRLWPGVLVGAFLTNLTTGDAITLPGTLASLGIAGGNTLEALLGAHLTNRFAGGRRAFDRAQDVFRFATLAALISTMVSATIGVTSLSLAGLAQSGDASTVWVTWWIGDACGALIFTPVLLLWIGGGRLVVVNRTRLLETGLLLLLVGVVSLAAFTNLLSPNAPIHLGLAFLCTPALLWAAFRCGRRETATALLLVSGTALWGWIHGMESGGLAPAQVLLALQAYLGITSVTAVAVAAEVSQRKQAEEALKESESRLRAFLESAAQGVVAVDRAGRILLVNAKTEELFGFSRQELLGRPLEVLLPEKYRGVHLVHRDEYFSSPRERPMGLGLDLAGRRKDGTEFPLEISLSTAGQGAGLLALALITDITDRKRLQEQLLETAKLESLGVLAGGIAHDFNNLLVGIMGNASLLLDTDLTDPERARVQDVLRASERAADLVRQLLAYAGKGRFTMEALDVSSLIRETMRLIGASVPKSVEVRLELADDLPLIEADSSQIQQLIMNLVINGAEAIGQAAGTVTVRTKAGSVEGTSIGGDGAAPGSCVYLEVEDTGCGMDPPTVARIFDPFFTTKFTGRGLGLSAALGIVKGHRGEIAVASTPGAGSRFTVQFPATAARPLTVDPLRAVELRGQGTILVVDDEEVVRGTAKAGLESFGYDVLLAANGKEAVEIFEAAGNAISLVLLDLSMPVMSGEETLHNLRRIRPGVAVILSSGYSEAHATRRFAGMGLAGFLRKPYTTVLLAEAVKAIIANGPGEPGGLNAAAV